MCADTSLVVTYDYGSLAPLRLAEAAAQNDCSIVFAVSGSRHAREMTPVLRMVGEVVETAAMTTVEAARALERFRPAGIVTFSEGQIAQTARLAHLLELPYHSPEDVGAITQKGLQRRRLGERGVESLRFREVSEVENVGAAVMHVGLPAVVKPASGASSRHTAPVSSEKECAVAVAGILADARERGETGRAIVEEMLVGRSVPHPWGDYLAVDCVATGNDVQPVFVTSKFALADPYRERGGYGQASSLPERELSAARDLACRAVRALGIRTGIADVEVKLTDEGPRVIEVNGRLGGWVDDLAVRSGVADPADTAVRAALGRVARTPAAGNVGELVAFHYLVMPPVTAHRVREVRDGLFSVRELPGVEQVRITTEPGATADWRVGTDGGVAAVLGIADSHDALAGLVERIESVHWIDYD